VHISCEPTNGPSPYFAIVANFDRVLGCSGKILRVFFQVAMISLNP
jgi:hypothetical protein